MWHRKVNPNNRNYSFPRVARTLAHRFFTFYFYFIITLVLCFPGAHNSCPRGKVPCSLLSFSSGPFHCSADSKHPCAFSHSFQKMGLKNSIQDTYHLRKCREEKEKRRKCYRLILRGLDHLSASLSHWCSLLLTMTAGKLVLFPMSGVINNY